MFQKMMESAIIPPLRPGQRSNPREVLEFTTAYRDMLRGAVVVECTNVAEYFQDTYFEIQGSGTSSDSFFEDLCAICPPYEKTFYEWRCIPEFMGDDVSRMGLFIAGTTPETIKDMPGTFSDRMLKEIEAISAKHSPKWLMVCCPFIEFKEAWQGSEFRGSYGSQIYAADAEGNLVGQYFSGCESLSKNDNEGVMSASLVGILAQSMINCKNIVTRTNIPAKKLNKARKKRGKNPMIEFKTIHIDPNQKTVAQAATCNPPTGATRKRGPRRGHVKDYRKGKGLFGRTKGVFYFGPQLSGDASKGICLPEYTVDEKKPLL
jgi:hypothetical protein